MSKTEFSTKTTSELCDKLWIGLVTTMTTNYVEKGVPLIRNSDIRANKISRDLINLAFDFANLHLTRTLRTGDVATVHTGDVGTSAVIPKDLNGAHGFATINSRLKKNIIIPEYYCWYLNSDFFSKQVYQVITGDGRNNLNLNDFVDLKVSFPPLPEQRRIARILSTIDSVIEKTQSAIDKYKAIKQGMLQDLFTRGIDIKTGKLRPLYVDAPDLYKPSKLGWIPNEWDALQIKNSTHSIMSNVDKHIREDEIKVLLCNYMDVYTNRYLTNQISFSTGSVNAAEYSRFLLQLHDVIITKDSETPDDIAVPSVLFENIQNLICGYHLCILRSNDLKHLNGEFLMLQLQLPDINRQFAIRANGSTRYGLTIDSIENSFIKIPKEIKEQTEIVLRLHTTDNKLISEESYLNKLQMLKSGLMSDLLSGEKRVKVDNEVSPKTA